MKCLYEEKQLSFSDQVDKTKYYYGIDYVRGVCQQLSDVKLFFDELGKISPELSFDNWKLWSGGYKFYSERYCFRDSAIFQICFNVDTDSFPVEPMKAIITGNNPGVLISISGDGLRFLRSINAELALYSLLKSHGFKCNRIDPCCDIYDPDNDIVPLVDSAFQSMVEGPAPGDPVIVSKKRIYNADHIVTGLKCWLVYDKRGCFRNWEFGHHGDDGGMFRMYNKLSECLTGRNSSISDELTSHVPDNYWVRLECEICNGKIHTRANDLFYAMLDGKSIGSLFASSIDRMFSVRNNDVVKDSSKYFSSATSELDLWVQFVEMSLKNDIFIQQIFTGNWVALPRLVRWIRRNSCFVYLVLKTVQIFPGLNRYILTHGRERCFDNKKNLTYLSDLGLFK